MRLQIRELIALLLSNDLVAVLVTEIKDRIAQERRLKANKPTEKRPKIIN